MKYTTKDYAWAGWYETPRLDGNRTVCDHTKIETGLLDIHGNKLYRAPNPMGFGKDNEW